LIELVTNSPFLNKLHLNFCFEGIEHTSLFEFVSLINNIFLKEVPYITGPDINAPNPIPDVSSLNIFTDNIDGMHNNECFIKTSNVIYAIKKKIT
jgi:hypothetical protein